MSTGGNLDVLNQEKDFCEQIARLIAVYAAKLLKFAEYSDEDQALREATEYWRQHKEAEKKGDTGLAPSPNPAIQKHSEDAVQEQADRLMDKARESAKPLC